MGYFLSFLIRGRSDIFGKALEVRPQTMTPKSLMNGGMGICRVFGKLLEEDRGLVGKEMEGRIVVMMDETKITPR